MQDKNYKSAVDAYKNALKSNPKDEKTRYNLALAKKMLEKYPPKPKAKKKNKNKKDDKKKEKNKEDKEKKGDGENKKDKEKKGDKEKSDRENKKKPSANKQRMDNILKAIGKDEKKVQEKVNANKTKTNTKISEKDW
jgi:hypothetical protein